MKILKNKNLVTLANLFTNAGHEIRVVGGAVRDHLLGIEPHDVDLCTTATPDEMIKVAEQNGIRYIPTGLQHGTVTFVVGEDSFEITTLRIDVKTDGRHAEVEFTRDFRLDAERRDFTINAMSMDMNGQLYDYFGGENDLRDNVVRFVGNAEERIREDFLRVLRYFRFFARFSGKFIPNEYKHLFSQKWVHEGIRNLSGERVWAEIKKTLQAPNGAEALLYISSLGLGPAVFGVEHWNYTNDESIQRQVRDILHSKYRQIQSLEGFDELKEAMVLAMLCVIRSNDANQRIMDRLKMSNFERKIFTDLIRMRFYFNRTFFGMNKNDVVTLSFHIFVSQGAHPAAAAVFVLLLGAWSGYEKIWDSKFLNTTYMSDGSIRFVEPFTPFTITGKKLIELGVKPGKTMGLVLRALRRHWENKGCQISESQILYDLFWHVKDFSDLTVLSFVGSEANKVCEDKVVMYDVNNRNGSAFYWILEHTEDSDVMTSVLIPYTPFVDLETIFIFENRAEAIKARMTLPFGDLYKL